MTAISLASLAESILQWATQRRDQHLLAVIADNGWPTDQDYIAAHITRTYRSEVGVSEWSHDGIPFLEESLAIGLFQSTQTFRRITITR